MGNWYCRNHQGGKGVRHLLPARPAGCFAQKAPAPFSAAAQREIHSGSQAVFERVAAWSAGLSVATPLFHVPSVLAAEPRPSGQPLLVVAKGKDYAALVGKLLEPLGGIAALVHKGDRVVVKPNIGWDRSPEQAATTHPGGGQDAGAAVPRRRRETGAGLRPHLRRGAKLFSPQRHPGRRRRDRRLAAPPATRSTPRRSRPSSFPSGSTTAARSSSSPSTRTPWKRTATATSTSRSPSTTACRS